MTFRHTRNNRVFLIHATLGNLDFFLTDNERFSLYPHNAMVFQSRAAAKGYIENGQWFGNQHHSLFRGNENGVSFLNRKYPKHSFHVFTATTNFLELSHDVSCVVDYRRRADSHASSASRKARMGQDVRKTTFWSRHFPTFAALAKIRPFAGIALRRKGNQTRRARNAHSNVS